MEAPWNRQIQPDRTVLLRNWKIEILGIFDHVFVESSGRWHMTSKVITIKCQLRIGLSSTKKIFSEQASPDDFRELSLTVFRRLKVKIGPKWPMQPFCPTPENRQKRDEICLKSRFSNFWVSQFNQAESDDFRELPWPKKSRLKRVLRSIYL